jgi:hypothetical protein
MKTFYGVTIPVCRDCDTEWALGEDGFEHECVPIPANTQEPAGDEQPVKLSPIANMSLTIAIAQLERGENPTINITAALVQELVRLKGDSK